MEQICCWMLLMVSTNSPFLANYKSDGRVENLSRVKTTLRQWATFFTSCASVFGIRRKIIAL